ncbi:hypothetical protein, partial [Bradyrhizobium sp. 45]|uniref:hypothetical protein n=1 Tax=Bradyrhizobium sp. 45 TaxID=1043587 RepID=UPI001FF88C3B
STIAEGPRRQDDSAADDDEARPPNQGGDRHACGEGDAFARRHPVYQDDPNSNTLRRRSEGETANRVKMRPGIGLGPTPDFV